ncbi:MAG: nuclear transport factor 2 family protein [Flavobacteriales bacterium]
MNRTIAILLTLVALCSCQKPERERAIRTVMAEQESAWDRGDIPGFMEGYSDTICLISRKGRTCGRDAVTANYIKSYPDRSAMGDLAFTIHEVLPSGSSNAWVTGEWVLYREADTVQGGFSLFWAKETEGWRIVRDHTY